MHAAPSPHAHVPSIAQLSERMASHVWQTEPLAPHAIGDCGKHIEPVQQPFMHVVASHPLHAPAVHVSPVGQGEHARPALPHAVGSVPGRHTVPSQQPLAHDVASQMHVPAAEQRCPARHAGPPPQPCMQREPTVPDDVHVQPSSIVQSGAQPSPAIVLPSSHASMRSRTSPSPQIAGAPRCTAITTMLPRRTVPVAPAEATSAPAFIPSTRAVNVAWSSASGRRTTMLSPVGASARGTSGRAMGANAVVGALPGTVSVPPKRS